MITLNLFTVVQNPEIFSALMKTKIIRYQIHSKLARLIAEKMHPVALYLLTSVMMKTEQIGKITSLFS